MPPVPVLLAVTGAPYEDTLVATLAAERQRVRVVRRCVDLADLLVAAQTGAAQAALLDAGLPRLDVDALDRLAAARVGVVGLAPAGDGAGRERWAGLGVRRVLEVDGDPAALGAAVTAALAGLTTAEPPAGYGDPRAALPPAGRELGPVEAEPEPAGRVVAVWGPTGAPGRTSVAVTVADEAARLGASTLLADADTYGGSVAQLLGLLDEAPGLVAAARAANAGALDPAALAAAARSVDAGLRVLTGLSRADRWPELRPAALAAVWRLARRLAALTVVDCGFSLERDEEISFDTAAPRRNGATLVTLADADLVLAVGAADPVGLHRLVRALPELRERAPSVPVRVVLNRVRRGPVGPDPERQLRAALERHAGVSDPVLVPDDRSAWDAVLASGRTLAEVAPRSAARRVLAALAADLVQLPDVSRRGRRRRR